MTVASVNMNFQLCLPQGVTAEDVEMHLLQVLTAVTANVPTVIEFDVLPGTQTKVDPFVPAPVVNIADRRRELEMVGGGGHF